MNPATGIDRANAAFWDELCGTSLAQALGVTGRDAASLDRFDSGYLALYPHLLNRVPVRTLGGRRVLEVGLGYGTLGQKIVEAGADYVGLDVAEGPVAMMAHRLRRTGLTGQVVRGSMLACPLADASVSCVVSIGCFHHTGDLQQCIDQAWRVLEPGGHAYVMVYNGLSYRRWRHWPRAALRTLVSGLGPRHRGSPATADIRASDAERRGYDADASGRAAPHTEFVSARRLRQMFGRFNTTRIARENCDPVIWRGRVLARRETLLPILGRAWGLDLYVEAVK